MSLGSLPEPDWFWENESGGINSAATRGLTNSQRLLLVSAFLAGERGTVCSFGRRHTIWRSALSAPCLNARIDLLHGDRVFLPSPPEPAAQILRASFASTSIASTYSQVPSKIA